MAALSEWAADAGIALGDVAYIGNDINDLGCLEGGRLAGRRPRCPSARARRAPLVLSRPGGAGAVRELADRVLTTLQPPPPRTPRGDRIMTEWIQIGDVIVGHGQPST